jgi:hypothetical protein
MARISPGSPGAKVRWVRVGTVHPQLAETWERVTAVSPVLVKVKLASALCAPRAGARDFSVVVQERAAGAIHGARNSRGRKRSRGIS